MGRTGHPGHFPNTVPSNNASSGPWEFFASLSSSNPTAAPGREKCNKSGTTGIVWSGCPARLKFFTVVNAVDCLSFYAEWARGGPPREGPAGCGGAGGAGGATGVGEPEAEGALVVGRELSDELALPPSIKTKQQNKP